MSTKTVGVNAECGSFTTKCPWELISYASEYSSVIKEANRFMKWRRILSAILFIFSLLLLVSMVGGIGQTMAAVFIFNSFLLVWEVDLVLKRCV